MLFNDAAWEKLMPDNAVALVILGIFAGILSGMFGIGGGVVIVPLLVALFGFELRAATGTSLAALLMPVGIFAVIAYYRAGKMRISVAVPVAAGPILRRWRWAPAALALPTKKPPVPYRFFPVYPSWRFPPPPHW